MSSIKRTLTGVDSNKTKASSKDESQTSCSRLEDHLHKSSDSKLKESSFLIDSDRTVTQFDQTPRFTDIVNE